MYNIYYLHVPHYLPAANTNNNNCKSIHTCHVTLAPEEDPRPSEGQGRDCHEVCHGGAEEHRHDGQAAEVRAEVEGMVQRKGDCFDQMEDHEGGKQEGVRDLRGAG